MKLKAKRFVDNEHNDVFLFTEIMRVNGGSVADNEFKWFQEELVSGGNIDDMWKWLCKNITFVGQKSAEYISLLKKDGPQGKLSDYTILFPDNKAVDKYNLEICKYKNLYTEMIPAIRSINSSVESMMGDGIFEVKIKNSKDDSGAKEEEFEDLL